MCSIFLSLISSFPDVFRGPGGVRKIREAERKNTASFLGKPRGGFRAASKKREMFMVGGLPTAVASLYVNLVIHLSLFLNLLEAKMIGLNRFITTNKKLTTSTGFTWHVRHELQSQKMVSARLVFLTH